MSADKEFCMSSYLTLRYIEDDKKDFYESVKHRRAILPPEKEKKMVGSAHDIDAAIEKQFHALRNERLGLLLSGGMDSAILASYMRGCDAYTFRFLNGEMQKEELRRAEYYAEYYGLKLHYVDIAWSTVKMYADVLMRTKGEPIHSIEPQIMQGALQAKTDGVERIVIGDGSDYVFYGMDKILAEDWDFERFVERITYLDPRHVLLHPVRMDALFERYRQGNKFDFLAFYDTVVTEESYLSYQNAFYAAGMPYVDPYEGMKMAEPVDLRRVRSGESKYWVRELFAAKYPNVPVPEKLPMPRPVDAYFADWRGPTRPEFKPGLDMSLFTGNQKWQLWCLERFLNINERFQWTW